MEKTKILVRMSVTLGIITLGSLILSSLALTDIYHNEPNLILEWNLVRAGLLITLMFVALSMVTMIRLNSEKKN